MGRSGSAAYGSLLLLLMLCGPAAAADPAALAFQQQDYARARTLWSERAGHGDPEALFQLGLLADLGEGEAVDAQKAYRLYRQAAEAGHQAAAFNVATMLDNGRGTTHDVKEAAIWYARVASHGDRRAEYDLGLLYQDGEGVPANPAMAQGWFQAAAQAGLPAARDKLQQGAPDLGRLHADAGLLPAALSWPTPQRALAERSVELVWSAPAEPTPVHYFIQVEDGQTKHELVARYVDLSAVLVQLPDTVRTLRWRVFTVSPRSAAYTVSGWSTFTARAGA